jgi:hypothetical protein
MNTMLLTVIPNKAQVITATTVVHTIFLLEDQISGYPSPFAISHLPPQPCRNSKSLHMRVSRHWNLPDEDDNAATSALFVDQAHDDSMTKNRRRFETRGKRGADMRGYR